MTYKIDLSYEVKQKIFDIADYWLKFYNNFDFIHLYYEEYEKIERILMNNPKIFPIYKNDI